MKDFVIPEYMKKYKNWVLWKLENVNNRLSKIPYSPNYEGRASSTNPSSWSYYDQALNVWNKNPNEYKGIGFVFTKDTGLIFIDLDHCFKGKKLLMSRAEIVYQFRETFWEVSQSGEGLHGFCLGNIPQAVKNSEAGIELYSEKRFVAFTGNALLNNPIKEYQKEVTTLYEKYRTHKDEDKRTTEIKKYVCTRDEQSIIDMACRNKRNGSFFSNLYQGKWETYYKSQSEGDVAFCNLLAFWCDCDMSLMDSIFRSSGLYRKKWEREDYRTRTLQRAITDNERTYTDWKREHEQQWEKNMMLWKQNQREENQKKLQNRLKIY